MSDRLIKSETLADIADAIRERTEKTEKINPSNFAEEIRTLEGERLEEYDGSVTVDEGATVVFEEDYTEGYNEGRSVGYSEGYDAGYPAGYSEGRTDGHSEGYSEGEKAGKQSEHAKMWATLQNEGGAQNYYVAFAYGKFTDENYDPPYPIRCSNGSTPGQQMFYNATGITDTKMPIYANNNNINQAFANTFIRRIPLLSVHASTGYTNTFAYCSELEEIEIEGTIGKDISFADCAKLKKQSLESIMTHISTTATLTASFSKKAVDKAFETSEGANDGSSSEAWLSLVSALPNATINLA